MISAVAVCVFLMGVPCNPVNPTPADPNQKVCGTIPVNHSPAKRKHKK